MYKDDKTSGKRCLRVLVLLAILLFVVRPLILLFAFLVLSAPWFFTLGICAAIIFSFASLFSCFIFKKTRTQALKAARIVFFSLVTFWVWAFALPLAITSLSWQDVQMVSSRLQFPLSMVNGIAVDNQERIYCSMPPYQRLQLYDNNGGFIRGWFAPIAKKAMGLRLVADANDNINVISARGYYIYDPNGRLLFADTDYSEKRFGNYPKSAEQKRQYLLAGRLLNVFVISQSP